MHLGLRLYHFPQFFASFWQPTEGMVQTCEESGTDLAQLLKKQMVKERAQDTAPSPPPPGCGARGWVVVCGGCAGWGCRECHAGVVGESGELQPPRPHCGGTNPHPPPPQPPSPPAPPPFRILAGLGSYFLHSITGFPRAPIA